jgi:CheY-like chemotaxis protein
MNVLFKELQGKPVCRNFSATSEAVPVYQKTVQQNIELQLRTVLLVDDDVDTRLLTKMFLNNFGYEVDSASSAGEALERFNPVLHDLVLTDNSMQGMTGGEMAHVIKLRSPATPVLMCTGNPPSDRSSIDVVITKPTHLLAIKDAIDKLLASK